MKLFYALTVTVLLVLMLAWMPSYAQGGHGGGNWNPDSLTQVTVSGTAIVDTSLAADKYYLDEDGDGNADYFLNFGPYWYQPDSSTAVRPNDGDAVTIFGGQHDPVTGMQTLPVVVVYEINGLFWRDPYTPFWGISGGQGGHHHFGNGGHHAFGWMHDTLETISLNGTALLDTTFQFNHYFLDEDQDGTPDYFLNFGPPWYEPTSGATRPNDGDQIDIVGGLLNRDSMDVVFVYEINGLVWRDSSSFGPQLGGGWIHRNMVQSQYMHTMWDSLSGMQVNPGWYQGGGGMNRPDSLYCRMLQVFPQNIPGVGNQHAFAGFEMGIFSPSGQNMMMMGGMMGGHMGFNNQAQLRFHYNEIQLQGFNINENTVQVKYYDPNSDGWIVVNDAVVNTVDNEVTFSSSNLGSFYILTGQENVTGIEDTPAGLADGFVLEQNYPNPFNPTTTISYVLNSASQVKLQVYNVVGQKIAELVNGQVEAGVHKVNFDAASLPTGIYFYELNVDGVSKIRKMSLLK